MTARKSGFIVGAVAGAGVAAAALAGVGMRMGTAGAAEAPAVRPAVASAPAFAPPPGAPLSFADIFEKVSPAVVQINVTSIAPGAFASDMNRAARDHGDEVAQRIPSGRIGVPEDMAAAAIYLASRAGNYVVGDTITVDGGVAHANLAGGGIDA